jgi:hypothetical protein
MSKDKSIKKEQKGKEAAHTLKEKRALKKEKKDSKKYQ